MVTLLVTIAVGVAAVLFAESLPLPRLADRMLAAGIGATAVLVGTGYLLSAPGPWFTRTGVLAVTAAVLAAGLALLRSSTTRGRLVTDLRRLVGGVTALPRAAGRHPLVTALCVGIAAVVGWRTAAGLVIGVRDYDGLWYHLVTTAAFVHEHRVGVRIEANYYSDAYAPNTEIVNAWFLLLSGSSRFMTVAQVPFALLGMLATAAIGRRWGLTVAASVGAGALFVATPIVLDQLSRGYNDVTVSVLMLTGLHFAAATVTDRDAGARTTVTTAVLAGAGLGLAIGGKASALPAGAIAAVIVLVGLVVRCRRRTLTRPAAVLAAVAGAGALSLLGAPYYVRNALVFGNPLRPFAFALGPLTLYGPLRVDGGLTSSFTPEWAEGLPRWLVVLEVWLGRATDDLGIEATKQLGWQWFVLWPCLFAVTALAATRFRPQAHYLVVAAVCLLAVLLQPVAWWGRYVLYVAAPASVALFVVVTAMERRDRRWRVVGRLGLAAVVLTALWPVHRLADSPAGVPESRFGAGTARLVPPSELLDRIRTGRRLTMWTEPQYGWAARAPAGSRIMVNRRSPYFMGPLYGPAAANTVVLVDEPVAPADLAGYLRGHRLDYVFLATSDPAARWAAGHPDEFREVGRGGGAVAYALRPP